MSIIETLTTPKAVAGHDPQAYIPVEPTNLVVTIDELVPYDGNPRQSDNPEYDNIKDSIRAVGLKHSINITRRPGASHYMIQDGGNTRLQILRELWVETKDERFFRHECKFTPWEMLANENKHGDAEVAVLVGHIIENEARGKMLFIERALAAARLKDHLERDLGRELSMRLTCDEFAELGWKLDNSSLSILLYGAANLYPYIPKAFWGGVGRPKVRELRSLKGAYDKYWSSIGEDTRLLEQIWQESLQKSDDPDGISTDHFRYQLESELSAAIEIDRTTINTEVSLILEGAQPSGIRPSSQPESAVETQHTVPNGNGGSGNLSNNEGRSLSQPRDPELYPAGNSDVESDGLDAAAYRAQIDPQPEQQESGFKPLGSETGDDTSDLTLSQALANCYQAAYALASKVGLERQIIALPDEKSGLDFYGAGFMISALQNHELRQEQLAVYVYLLFQSGFGFSGTEESRNRYWQTLCTDVELAMCLAGHTILTRGGSPISPYGIMDVRAEMSALDKATRQWWQYCTDNNIDPHPEYDDLFYPGGAS